MKKEAQYNAPLSEYSFILLIGESNMLYVKQSRSLSISKMSLLTCLTSGSQVSACLGNGTPDPNRSSISCRIVSFST